jgi:hypothetical protein
VETTRWMTLSAAGDGSISRWASAAYSKNMHTPFPIIQVDSLPRKLGLDAVGSHPLMRSR